MSAINQTRALEVVAEHWGDTPPEFIRALAEACESMGSQSQVAKRIGYSPAVVSTVLKRAYRGDLSAVEAKIRATLLAETIQCPAVGQEIELATCLDHQQHAKAGNRSSAFRARMTVECRSCRHSRIGG